MLTLGQKNASQLESGRLSVILLIVVKKGIFSLSDTVALWYKGSTATYLFISLGQENVTQYE